MGINYPSLVLERRGKWKYQRGTGNLTTPKIYGKV